MLKATLDYKLTDECPYKVHDWNMFNKAQDKNLLQLTCKLGCNGLVEYILDNGVNYDTYPKNTEPPVFIAVRCGFHKILIDSMTISV